MWGNRLGWGLSGAMVVIVGGLLGLVIWASLRITPPTEFTAQGKHLEAMALPVDPAGYLAASTEPGNAGELYRQAIIEYGQNAQRYQAFTSNPRKLSDLDNLPAAADLLKAAQLAPGAIFADKPGVIVSYDNQELVDSIEGLGNVLTMAGSLARREKNFDLAEKYFQAAFAFGCSLYKERLTRGELGAGLGMMSGAAVSMQRMAVDQGKTDLANHWQDFLKAYSDYDTDWIKRIERVISSIDQKVLERHAGDVYVLATQSQERLWRIEAILKLGRYRYNAGRKGDQRQAARFVKQLASEATDPAIRAAAVAARDLTPAQYHQLGN